MSTTKDAIVAALEAGDVDALLSAQRELFGDARMSTDAGSGFPATPGVNVNVSQSSDETDDGEGDDEDKDGEDKDDKDDKSKDRIKALNDENKKWREKYQAERNRAAELEKAAGKDASLEDRVSRAEARAAEAEVRALRRDVAIEHGLNKADAALLEGLSDEEQLNAIAARFARDYKKSSDEGQDDSRSTRRVGVKGSTTGRRGGGGAPSQDEVGRAFFGV